MKRMCRFLFKGYLKEPENQLLATALVALLVMGSMGLFSSWKTFLVLLIFYGWVIGESLMSYWRVSQEECE